MAKIKCSEIAQMMTEAVQALAADGRAKTIEEAHQIIQQDVPGVTFDALASNLNEYISVQRANRVKRAQDNFAAIRQEVDKLYGRNIFGRDAEQEAAYRESKTAEKKAAGQKEARTKEEKQIASYLARIEYAIARGADEANPRADQDLSDGAKALLGLKKIVDAKDKAAAAHQRQVEKLDAQIAALERGNVLPATHGPKPAPNAEIARLKAKKADLLALQRSQFRQGAIDAKKANQPAPSRPISSAGQERALKSMANLEKMNDAIAQMEKDLQAGDVEKYKPSKREKFQTNLERNAEVKLQNRRREVMESLAEQEGIGRMKRAFGILNAIGQASLSMDLGPLGRQGGAALRVNPKAWIRAVMGSSFKRGDHLAFRKEIENRPDYWLIKKSGLPITDGTSIDATKREDFAMSQKLNKVAGFGHVEGFNEMFLNKLRLALWDLKAAEYGPGGPTVEEAKAIARSIGDLTGRAVLEGKMATAATVAAHVNLSPRFYFSRLRMLGWASMWQAPKGSKARKLIRRDLATYWAVKAAETALIGGAASLYNSLNDDDDEKRPSVEKNPLSARVGMVRFGNQWVGGGEGLSRFATLISQLVTGYKKNARTGEYQSLRGPGYLFPNRPEPGYGKDDAGGVLGDFFANRTPFIPRTGLALLKGKFPGSNERVTAQGLAESPIPLIVRQNFARESREALQDHGAPPALIKTVGDFFALWEMQADEPKGKKKDPDYSRPNLIFEKAGQPKGPYQPPKGKPDPMKDSIFGGR